MFRFFVFDFKLLNKICSTLTRLLKFQEFPTPPPTQLAYSNSPPPHLLSFEEYFNTPLLPFIPTPLLLGNQACVDLTA